MSRQPNVPGRYLSDKQRETIEAELRGENPNGRKQNRFKSEYRKRQRALRRQQQEQPR